MFFESSWHQFRLRPFLLTASKSNAPLNTLLLSLLKTYLCHCPPFALLICLKVSSKRSKFISSWLLLFAINSTQHITIITALSSPQLRPLIFPQLPCLSFLHNNESFLPQSSSSYFLLSIRLLFLMSLMLYCNHCHLACHQVTKHFTNSTWS